MPCLFVYKNIYVCMYTKSGIYTYKRRHLHILTYVCVYIHMCIYIYLHAHMSLLPEALKEPSVAAAALTGKEREAEVPWEGSSEPRAGSLKGL